MSCFYFMTYGSTLSIQPIPHRENTLFVSYASFLWESKLIQKVRHSWHLLWIWVIHDFGDVTFIPSFSLLAKGRYTGELAEFQSKALWIVNIITGTDRLGCCIHCHVCGYSEFASETRFLKKTRAMPWAWRQASECGQWRSDPASKVESQTHLKGLQGQSHHNWMKTWVRQWAGWQGWQWGQNSTCPA